MIASLFGVYLVPTKVVTTTLAGLVLVALVLIVLSWRAPRNPRCTADLATFQVRNYSIL